jgi:hypothetical protein
MKIRNRSRASTGLISSGRLSGRAGSPPEAAKYLGESSADQNGPRVVAREGGGTFYIPLVKNFFKSYYFR